MEMDSTIQSIPLEPLLNPGISPLPQLQQQSIIHNSKSINRIIPPLPHHLRLKSPAQLQKQKHQLKNSKAGATEIRFAIANEELTGI